MACATFRVADRSRWPNHPTSTIGVAARPLGATTPPCLGGCRRYQSECVTCRTTRAGRGSRIHPRPVNACSAALRSEQQRIAVHHQGECAEHAKLALTQTCGGRSTNQMRAPRTRSPRFERVPERSSGQGGARDVQVSAPTHDRAGDRPCCGSAWAHRLDSAARVPSPITGLTEQQKKHKTGSPRCGRRSRSRRRCRPSPPLAGDDPAMSTRSQRSGSLTMITRRALRACKAPPSGATRATRSWCREVEDVVVDELARLLMSHRIPAETLAIRDNVRGMPTVQPDRLCHPSTRKRARSWTTRDGHRPRG